MADHFEDIKALLTMPEMTPDEKRIRQWLRQCYVALDKYTPDEKVWLAVKLLDVSYGMACKVISSLNGSAIASHVDNRFASYWIAFLHAVKDIERIKIEKNKVDLSDLWYDVIEYQTGEVIVRE